MARAVGWEKGAKAPWIIVTDEAAGPDTLRDYGLRFTIEAGFWDHQSGGFQWERSTLRDVEARQRLCLVMAAARLVLVCQGAEVVAAGRRREVDQQGFRGLSYARIGGPWRRRASVRGLALIRTLVLPTARDPEPAKASRRQADRSRWMDNMPRR